MCTHSWLAGKLGMFADARRVCAEERPCDDEVSHYPYGVEVSAEMCSPRRAFHRNIFEVVFGFELAVWV